MQLGKTFWGLALGAALLACACGGDDDDDGNGGTSGTSGGGTSGNVMCDPEDDGVCENDTDCPMVESGDARSSAQSCGQGCLQDDDPEACSVACIVDKGVTEGCATCYAATVNCSIENCFAECAANPASAGCSTCQVESGCRAAFDSCSGLPPQE
jgi:hypothetical protein